MIVKYLKYLLVLFLLNINLSHFILSFYILINILIFASLIVVLLYIRIGLVRLRHNHLLLWIFNQSWIVLDSNEKRIFFLPITVLRHSFLRLTPFSDHFVRSNQSMNMLPLESKCENVTIHLIILSDCNFFETPFFIDWNGDYQ